MAQARFAGRLLGALGALLLVIATAAADETADRVDRLFAAWDTTTTPGAQLIVIRDGRVVHKRGYGMADLEQDVVMTPATIIMMNSTSKQITAAAIALLARDGKISLDDDIRKYLPELPAYSRTVTIRQMIHHTSGLRDYTELLPLLGFQDDADCPTVEETLELLSRQRKLNFLPGERYEYSNTGYFLLGRIVERASGKSLDDFVQDRIFRPLGMTHSHIHSDHTQIVRNRAHAYAPVRDGYRIYMTNWEQTGDGGVFTNVEDLFFWDQAFFDEKLGPGFSTGLQTEGILNDGRKNGYAFGLRIGAYRGLRTVSHSGSWVGYRSAVLRFPDQRFSVICLANVSTLGPMERCLEVADIYLADAFKAPAVRKAEAKPAFITLPASELEARAGNYRDERGGTWASLSVKDGGLALAEGGGDPILFRPLGPSSFAADLASEDATLEFAGGTSKAPLRAKLVQSEEGRSFVRAPAAPPLTPALLNAYAGTYYSAELDVVYRVEVRNGELFVKYRNSSKRPLRLMAPDRFALGGMAFDFVRKGGIRGFTLNTPGIPNIEFVKR
jgi:CubicO group peptidase (beta-lactamase class C family)